MYPGSIAIDLATKVSEGQVVCLKPTAEYFEETFRLAASRHVKDISFEVGDARKLSVPDQTFDVVYMHQVLRYIDSTDRIKAIYEMGRVTKLGGLVAIREADQGTITFYPNINVPLVKK